MLAHRDPAVRLRARCAQPKLASRENRTSTGERAFVHSLQVRNPHQESTLACAALASARLEGGVNTYAYVGGNPVSNTDLLGLACDCNTKLPNGQTVGQVVNQQRVTLQQAVIGSQVFGTLSQPILALSFLSIAAPQGPIDFKNVYRGQGDGASLGQAGNFAYYAIGTGFFSPGTLDFGAGAYGVTSALFGSKPFSSLTGPMFSDASAASVRNDGLNGCPP